LSNIDQSQAKFVSNIDHGRDFVLTTCRKMPLVGERCGTVLEYPG
jgi:hypothetical protein